MKRGTLTRKEKKMECDLLKQTSLTDGQWWQLLGITDAGLKNLYEKLDVIPEGGEETARQQILRVAKAFNYKSKFYFDMFHQLPDALTVQYGPKK